MGFVYCYWRNWILQSLHCARRKKTLEYICENPDSYEDYEYQCNGSFTKDENTIRCYHGMNHGTIDFQTSFAKSCNSSFANIGIDLNRTEFSKTLKTLLFNQNLPVDFVTTRSYVVYPWPRSVIS